MADIPIWLLGKNTTTCTVRVYTVNAAGTLAAGTPNLDLVGLIDEVDYRGRTSVENVVALTSVRENFVPTEIDDSVVLTEILQAGTGSRNFLAQVWYNASASPYVLWSMKRGASTWSGYFIIESYVEGIRKAKSTGRMTLRQIDLGNATANPDYVSAVS